MPAITPETRLILTRELDKHFRSEHGEDLQAVVSEILNDKDLFTFLATFLKRGDGLSIGRMNYFDDTHVDVVYGLTIDFDRVPRTISLYSYEDYSSLSHQHFALHDRFPDYSSYGAYH